MPNAYARTIVVALAGATLLGAASPQVTPDAAGTVHGRVVAADDGAPLARAHVVLSGPGFRDGIHALTDEEGLYELADVPPGTYQVKASKAGYAPLVHGQRRPGDSPRPVVVGTAATIDDVDFALPRAGVIVVRVVDRLGDPIAGLYAMAEQRRFVDGERRLVLTGDPFLAETDDRGEIRLADLAPGEYYVRAGSMSLTGRDPRSYAQRYFPGASSPDEAQPVRVGAGGETQVTIHLAAERFATVSGIVLGADGAPLRAGRIRISGSSISMFITPPETGGSFSFPRVPPGQYVLEVGPNPTGDPVSTDVASVPVIVTGEDVSGLVVTARSGGRLEGRLVFETPLPPDVRPGAFEFRADRGSSDVILPRFTVGDDGTFEAAGFLGPRVLRLRSAPAGWFLKSVFVGGRDVIDTPVDFGAEDITGVEIVLTQTHSIVTGAVIDADGDPVADSVVVVFPENRDEWQMHSRFFGTAVPGADGTFRVEGLPAGRYLAAALDRLQSGEERDPALLDRISTRAESLSLAEGETRTLNLRPIEPR